MAVALVAVGCEEDEQPIDPATAGGLVVTEERLPRSDERRSIEGSVQFVEARRAGEDEPAVTLRLSQAPARQVLPAGSYVISSYTRACSASCSNLEDATDRCERRVRVEPRETVELTVRVATGARCALDLRG